MVSTTPKAAWRNVLILVLAQATLGSQVTMIFTIGGLIGIEMAPTPCLATLPLTMIILGSTTTAPWLSVVMQKFGRRVGFWVGALGGLAGSIVAFQAIGSNNFWLFLFGSYLTGIYHSSQGFFRFAATDSAPSHFKSKAISYVLAGGLVSALVGPQAVKATKELTEVSYGGSYLAAMALNLAGMAILFFLREPDRASSEILNKPARSRLKLLSQPVIAVSIICALVSYSMMNLVMTSAPIAIVGCGYTTARASDVVSAHVVAMFLPSFFTGNLINRFGEQKVIAVGLVILAAAGVIGLTGVTLSNFFIGLILLGIGWNFGYIGATTLLTSSTPAHEQPVVQGMNEMFVSGSVMLASLTSGGLLNCSGSSVQQGWNLVNIAMMSLVLLAAAALIWFWFNNKSLPENKI